MTIQQSSSPEPVDQPPPEGVIPSLDRVRLSGPAEIVQVVPYLIGFEPRDSLVLVAMRPPRNRVALSVRVDLGEPLDAVVPWFEAAVRHGADSIVTVVYDLAVFSGVDLRSLAHRDLVSTVTDLAAEYGLEVIDSLAVDGERWWSYVCSSPTCCPSEGTALVRDGAVAAAAVASGLVAQADRESIEAEIATDVDQQAQVLSALHELGDQGRRRWSMSPGVGSLRTRRRQAWELIEAGFKRYQGSALPMPAADAAIALLAMADVRLRDALLTTAGSQLQPDAPGFWAGLCRSAPEELVPAPATLFAFCAYARGDGARANVGLERALTADPAYRLAQLLACAVSGGLSPFDTVPVIVEGAQKERARLLRRSRRTTRPRTR